MDKIWQTLLTSAFGKNMLGWMFSILAASSVALGGYCVHLALELKECNGGWRESERSYRSENEKLLREQISYLNAVNERFENVITKKTGKR